MEKILVLIISIIILISCGESKKGGESKQQSESSKYETLDYLYGSWSCVASGVSMKYRINPGNTYSYQDDMSGFSSGTWEGDNSSIQFYDKGFPVSTGYINSSGELIISVQNYNFTYTKQ